MYSGFNENSQGGRRSFSDPVGGGAARRSNSQTTASQLARWKDENRQRERERETIFDCSLVDCNFLDGIGSSVLFWLLALLLENQDGSKHGWCIYVDIDTDLMTGKHGPRLFQLAVLFWLPRPSTSHPLSISLSLSLTTFSYTLTSLTVSGGWLTWVLASLFDFSGRSCLKAKWAGHQKKTFVQLRGQKKYQIESNLWF